MNHYQIFAKLHAPPVLLVVHQKNVFGSLRELIRRSVQRIVKCLGNFKKIVPARDHIPMCENFQFRQERQRVPIGQAASAFLAFAVSLCDGYTRGCYFTVSSSSYHRAICETPLRV